MRVLADGCFDPLHWGHIRHFQAARVIGDLIVHVAPDEAIRVKGRLPFQTRQERVNTIAALRVVDKVVQHHSLAEALRKERPNCLVKGREWAGRLPDAVMHECMVQGIIIFYTETIERASTERLAGRDLGDEHDGR